MFLCCWYTLDDLFTLAVCARVLVLLAVATAAVARNSNLLNHEALKMKNTKKS